MFRFFGTESVGMDGTSDGAQEAETLFEIPDIGIGKRVPVQRLRFQTETLGAGAQSQPDGASSQDLVPEPADEEQEKQPEATGRWQQQQQQRRQC